MIKEKIKCCEVCGSKKMLSRHHRFPQTKANLKYYGKKSGRVGTRLIDHPFNIQILCLDCHIGEKGVERWDEMTFCDALGIKPRSKVGKMIGGRIELYNKKEELIKKGENETT